jgi:hypothetical protein
VSQLKSRVSGFVPSFLALKTLVRNFPVRQWPAMAARQLSLTSLLGTSGHRKSLKQQLDAASVHVEAGRTTLAELPAVRIGCKKYMPEEYIANKNRKGRRSWIQAHGFFLTEISPDLQTLQTYWCARDAMSKGRARYLWHPILRRRSSIFEGTWHA